MRFLNPQSRYEPRYEATLSDVFEEIEFVPYSNGVRQRSGWLYLCTLDMRMGYSGGWYYVKFKPELAEMLAFSIYGNNLSTLHENHSLRLLKRDDGTVRLIMQFSRIIGSYHLMEVGEAEALSWLNRHKEAA